MPPSTDLSDKWDARYRGHNGPGAPSRVLTENAYLLPPRGDALDLACGMGADALFLARRGLQVSAWDLSPVALRLLQDRAGEQGLSLSMQTRDVLARPPEPDSFDVIVVGHFLDRGLVPAIHDALRPGGLLFYQTFIREAVSARGPSNPDYRLGPNELLSLFDGLLIRVYREEGRLGDVRQGCRDLALLVAQRSPHA